MHRRLGLGFALASMAPALLAGCSQPGAGAEQAPSTVASPSLSDAEVLAGTERAYQRLLDEVGNQYEERRPSEEGLLLYATAPFAAELSSQVEENLGQHLQLVGAPLVTGAVLDERSSASASIGVCLDGSTVRVVDPESGAELPATSTTETAWTVRFEIDGDDFRAAARDPRSPSADDPCE